MSVYKKPDWSLAQTVSTLIPVSWRPVRILAGASLAVGLHAGGLGRVRVSRPQVLPQAVHVGRDQPVGLFGRTALLLSGEALRCSGLGAGGLA